MTRTADGPTLGGPVSPVRANLIVSPPAFGSMIDVLAADDGFEAHPSSPQVR
ncbi:hypothetical protein [Streptosporangium sp. NPDC002721]|uniref:hypothetical protein n=1 Tax=Streptosporangium sp. NPDC002721 TaxID=3366188 RepID=UPI0036A45495